jgi:hypothetical protein
MDWLRWLGLEDDDEEPRHVGPRKRALLTARGSQRSAVHHLLLLPSLAVLAAFIAYSVTDAHLTHRLQLQRAYVPHPLPRPPPAPPSQEGQWTLRMAPPVRPRVHVAPLPTRCCHARARGVLARESAAPPNPNPVLPAPSQAHTPGRAEQWEIDWRALPGAAQDNVRAQAGERLQAATLRLVNSSTAEEEPLEEELDGFLHCAEGLHFGPDCMVCPAAHLLAWHPTCRASLTHALSPGAERVVRERVATGGRMQHEGVRAHP